MSRYVGLPGELGPKGPSFEMFMDEPYSLIREIESRISLFTTPLPAQPMSLPYIHEKDTDIGKVYFYFDKCDYDDEVPIYITAKKVDKNRAEWASYRKALEYKRRQLSVLKGHIVQEFLKGPQGHEGPPGAHGPQGPQGPAGIQGKSVK